MKPFRILTTLTSVVGLFLLAIVIIDWQYGILAGRYFPDAAHETRHHLYGLLLALPVPLHVIFIGLILQKKYLSPPWAKFAWVGIVTSGLWLGASLAIRLFVLPAA